MKNNILFLLLFGSYSLFCATLDRFIYVVIPSYNNENRVFDNLDSVFQQKNKNGDIYAHKKIIYINDGSTDTTGQKVKEYIAVNGLTDNDIVYIENTCNKGKAYNIYNAIHKYCTDESAIMLELDGDDMLYHTNVFNIVNEAYDNGAWATYSQYIYSDGNIGHCTSYSDQERKDKEFRKYEWRVSALRTCYVGLFKQIQLETFFDKGKFLSTTVDLAYYFAILEMAGDHVHFIPEVLYYYDIHSPINDFKVEPYNQWRVDFLLRNKQKYQQLSYYTRKSMEKGFSVLSFDTGLNFAIINSNEVSAPEKIVYFTNSIDYPACSTVFPQDHCCANKKEKVEQACFDLVNHLESLQSNYILIINSDAHFDTTQLLSHFEHLYQTQAAVIFGVKQNLFNYNPVLFSTLYNKQYRAFTMQSLHLTLPDSFEKNIKFILIDRQRLLQLIKNSNYSVRNFDSLLWLITGPSFGNQVGLLYEY